MVLATGSVTSPSALFALFLVFWLITAPAFALANAIALRHLPRPIEQFAGVRLWGTVGWMAVGWIGLAVMAWSGSAQRGQGGLRGVLGRRGARDCPGGLQPDAARTRPRWRVGDDQKSGAVRRGPDLDTRARGCRSS